jgi:hypothetical protein
MVVLMYHRHKLLDLMYIRLLHIKSMYMLQCFSHSLKSRPGFFRAEISSLGHEVGLDDAMRKFSKPGRSQAPVIQSIAQYSYCPGATKYRPTNRRFLIYKARKIRDIREYRSFRKRSLYKYRKPEMWSKRRKIENHIAKKLRADGRSVGPTN